VAKDVKVLEKAWKSFLKKVDRKTVERIKGALRLLKGFPEPTGLDIKPLKGVEVRLSDGTLVKGWRLRIGKWRVLFYYDPALDLVVVFRIKRRKKAYRGI